MTHDAFSRNARMVDAILNPERDPFVSPAHKGTIFYNHHCPVCNDGEKLTGNNLILRKRGGRDCRACLRVRQAKSRNRLAVGLVECLARVPAEQAPA